MLCDDLIYIKHPNIVVSETNNYPSAIATTTATAAIINIEYPSPWLRPCIGTLCLPWQAEHRRDRLRCQAGHHCPGSICLHPQGARCANDSNRHPHHLKIRAQDALRQARALYHRAVDHVLCSDGQHGWSACYPTAVLGASQPPWAIKPQRDAHTRRIFVGDLQVTGGPSNHGYGCSSS